MPGSLTIPGGIAYTDGAHEPTPSVVLVLKRGRVATAGGARHPHLVSTPCRDAAGEVPYGRQRQCAPQEMVAPDNFPEQTRRSSVEQPWKRAQDKIRRCLDKAGAGAGGGARRGTWTSAGGDEPEPTPRGRRRRERGAQRGARRGGGLHQRPGSLRRCPASPQWGELTGLNPTGPPRTHRWQLHPQEARRYQSERQSEVQNPGATTRLSSGEGTHPGPGPEGRAYQTAPRRRGLT